MTSRRATLALLVAGLAVSGCAAHTVRHMPPGVSVDSRPSPPPTPAPTADDHPAAGRTSTDSTAVTPVPVGSVMSADERRSTLARIVADTTTAGGAVRKCGARNLLPDQASVLETTRSLLEQARAALASDELWRAESLARKARQLAASLDCPG